MRPLSTYRDLLHHPKVIALGEIGLDYYRDLSPRDTQKSVFEKQLDLAEETGMPIIIHNRDAYDDILPILENRKGKIRGVLHCFTGDVERMQKSLDIGFHIGIGGIVTYPKATDVQLVAKEVPIDRVLIETDCPWLTPQFRRGRRNEPAYVRAVAEKIAELRNISVEIVGETSGLQETSFLCLELIRLSKYSNTHETVKLTHVCNGICIILYLGYLYTCNRWFIPFWT